MLSNTVPVAARSLLRNQARLISSSSSVASSSTATQASTLVKSAASSSRIARRSLNSTRSPLPLCIRGFSSSSVRPEESSKAGAGEQKGSDAAAADPKAEGSKSGAAASEDVQAAALKEKDAKIKELNDSLLYARADLQNMVRRGAEDKANASDYAITKLARDLVSSLDILQIALRSVPDSLRKASGGDSSGDSEDPRRVLSDLYSGLELTERSLLDMLKSHGVSEFDPTGEKFDPALHEALYQAPVPGKTPGTVLECQKRGYKIKNRVLRAAQVGVVQSTD
ncbi:GrpE, mitochondrial [Tilletia horrida]|uniref:GrpE protein homolog n=1 Tax=Tilletia horrida TaxID=155126 RepID=A0AAN6JVF1_9BASI|nr:GrpE, mitochondrial [Tilletia horrida]KAK0555422.1 GrpE, mitochondrial [Tilletia horrida]KAK0568814.1 GrpE, mitochondrial [Tilletia horrida]